MNLFGGKVGQTVVDVVGHGFGRDPFNCRADREKLSHEVVATTSILQQSGDPADLSFGSGKAIA